VPIVSAVGLALTVSLARPVQVELLSDELEVPDGISAEAAAASPPAQAPDFNFDLVPEKQRSAQEIAQEQAIERSQETRRSLLQWHQAFGIATAVLTVATLITGQLNYSDKFGGGQNSGQYEVWHDVFETTTVLTFATAGILALAAPSPPSKPNRGLDTITIHKWSMLVAAVGIVTQIVLGIVTVSQEGHIDQATLATTHLVVGYVTGAAVLTGTTVLFFP
jgi:cytochrome b561